jgi:8-oxo-dGTP pyrophosphatase MutT (NUDIX family)
VSRGTSRASIARVGEIIRKAASVIVARRASDGFEMLVLERASTSRFLPNYVAFPGGSVESDDGDLARRWFGDADEAARACAVRELAEEVALALTADGVSIAGDRSLAAVDSAPPPVAVLPEIAHWVAPQDVPVRFDARFFALEAPGDLVVEADGVETADAWWISPRALLEDWRLERRKLYWPTYFTVTAISACESVDDLLALRITTREPDDDELERLPRSTFWQD